MALSEQARAAVVAGGKADLRIEQALEIVHGYDDARDRREPGRMADAAELPFPKETIKWALLLLLEAIADGGEREPLKAAYVGLAEWQSRVDAESGGFDSMRLRRKLDPLRLAQELAANATPEDRALAASRTEQAALIAELRRKGFW